MESLLEKFQKVQDRANRPVSRRKSETELFREIESLRDEIVNENYCEPIETVDWRDYRSLSVKEVPKTNDDEFLEEVEDRIHREFFSLSYRFHNVRPLALTAYDRKWIIEICRWLENLGKLFKGKTLARLSIHLDFSQANNHLEIHFLLPKNYPKVVETLRRLKLDKLHYDPVIQSNFKMTHIKNSFGHDEFNLLVAKAAPPEKPVPPPKKVAKPRIVI